MYCKIFSVPQFEDALIKPEPREDLLSLVDPKLGENYPIDSVLKVKIHCIY